MTENALQIELIKLAQAGDREAMTMLFEKYQPLLWKFAIKAALNREHIDDLFQIACVHFMASVQKFETDRELKLITYLYARIPLLLKRERINYFSIIHVPQALYWSEDLRCPPVASTSQESGELHKASSENVFANISDREEAMLLRAAIEELPDRLRHVLDRRLQGEILDTIAVDLEITRQGVALIEKRAIGRVKARIADPKQKFDRTQSKRRKQYEREQTKQGAKA